MDEEENLIQTERVATQTRPNLTIISTRRPQGAALPPAQGGPGFSAVEMAALGGGSPTELHPYTGSEPLPKWNRDNERQAMPESGIASIDIDSLRKQIESDIDSLGKTAALPQEARAEEAGLAQSEGGREMNQWVLPKESAPQNQPQTMEASQIARLSLEERRSAGVSEASYRDAVRTMDERRRRMSTAAQGALRRSLSGGGTTGRRISDDEAFGAEDAIIVSSADSFEPRPPF